ncbi:MAG: NADP-dependent malic enzyme [Bacteroidetes bacterium]|nr:NADP-dependent malic enzyme [Bacteroidota bacterium]
MPVKDFYQASLDLHRQYKGKISLQAKMAVTTKEDLSTVYSPGVAAPCQAIAENPEDAYTYTIKSNTVAVVSDGSAVLGLGNIGALAAIPVMEGKAMLFKKFAGIDAFPICLNTQDTDEIVRTIRNIAPVFGGINLEDIAAPRSFEVEERLQDLGIPVFHDDQHGTAIVVLAALINAAKVLKKDINSLNIVINGAGAAGVAIAKLLKGVGAKNPAISVNNIILCDRKGVLHRGRIDLNDAKLATLAFTNNNNLPGSLRDALCGADVFIGVSEGNLLQAADIKTMAKDPVVLALANPTPEIMPEEALAGGAAIVGTGRSDLPNQVNNVLGFPGIFRGALDARADRITIAMKLAAAHAIARCVKRPGRTLIIPASLDQKVAKAVAKAVYEEALKDREFIDF